MSRFPEYSFEDPILLGWFEEKMFRPFWGVRYLWLRPSKATRCGMYAGRHRSPDKNWAVLGQQPVLDSTWGVEEGESAVLVGLREQAVQVFAQISGSSEFGGVPEGFEVFVVWGFHLVFFWHEERSIRSLSRHFRSGLEGRPQVWGLGPSRLS